jgi:hypothetical protein
VKRCFFKREFEVAVSRKIRDGLIQVVDFVIRRDGVSTALLNFFGFRFDVVIPPPAFLAEKRPNGVPSKFVEGDILLKRMLSSFRYIHHHNSGIKNLDDFPAVRTLNRGIKTSPEHWVQLKWN